jgi:hypothetical protein
VLSISLNHLKRVLSCTRLGYFPLPFGGCCYGALNAGIRSSQAENEVIPSSYLSSSPIIIFIGPSVKTRQGRKQGFSLFSQPRRARRGRVWWEGRRDFS